MFSNVEFTFTGIVPCLVGREPLVLKIIKVCVSDAGRGRLVQCDMLFIFLRLYLKLSQVFCLQTTSGSQGGFHKTYYTSSFLRDLSTFLSFSLYQAKTGWAGLCVTITFGKYVQQNNETGWSKGGKDVSALLARAHG